MRIKQIRRQKGGSFVISEGKILSFYHGAIYIKLYNPSNNKKRRKKEKKEAELYSEHK